mmetsp:Transcript_34145/g.77922  ORF Transcript_34145/g.77922 Transcript_34145/m.77922 type:complete len:411 (-) Transcript_34145:44-1276(-)
MLQLGSQCMAPSTQGSDMDLAFDGVTKSASSSGLQGALQEAPESSTTLAASIGDHISAVMTLADKQRLVRVCEVDEKLQGHIQSAKEAALAEVQPDLRAALKAIDSMSTKLSQQSMELAELRAEVKALRSQKEISCCTFFVAWGRSFRADRTSSRDGNNCKQLAQMKAEEEEEADVRAKPSSASKDPPIEAQHGLMWPANSLFEQAMSLTVAEVEAGMLPEANALKKAEFVSGLERLAIALDQVGGAMGSYFTTNTQKFRNAEARGFSEAIGYREWLLDEVDLHASKGFKEYVDESAWMGNLWTGWLLEFWTEVFVGLHKGVETKRSVDEAYEKTLAKHHNLLQRMAFFAAVKTLPNRLVVFDRLSPKREIAEAEIAALIVLIRVLARFCVDANAEIEALMSQRRGAGKD